MTAKKHDKSGKHKKPKRHIPPPPSEPWKLATFSFSSKGDGRNKKEERAIEQSLESIYLSEGDDLATISKKKTHRMLRIAAWCLGLLATASALAWAGLIYFQPDRTNGAGQLALAIQAPDAVTLGKEEAFVIQWKNRSFESVRDADIRLSFPAEFTPTNLQPRPADEETMRWMLGRLSPGDEGTIEVRGVFLGELGGQGAMQVIATYRSTGSEENFDALATHVMNYESAVVQSELILPPNVVAGDEVELAYAVQNHSDRELSNLRARILPPSGFVPAATGTWSTIPETGELEWTIDTLAGGTTTTVRVRGSFASGSSGETPISARIGTKAFTGSFLAINTAETVLPVLAGDLGLRFVVNGSDADRTAQPGDPLRMAVAFENVSPETLRDVELVIGFESIVNDVSATGTSLLDWPNAEITDGGVSSTKRRIQIVRYDGDSLGQLKTLLPQQEGSVEIAIPTLPVESGTRDARIRITVEGLVGTVGRDEVNRRVRTKPIEIRYRTDADIRSSAAYFTEEGAPLGSGPLPPVAGETTAYRVTWRLEKRLHELENVTVRATLPATSAWSDRTIVDAGTLAYDEETRTVTWTLNRMPQDVSNLQASFEIQVTPSELDVGRFAALLGETRLEASDIDVQESVIRSKPALTTDLQNDEGARGKGVVRERD